MSHEDTPVEKDSREDGDHAGRIASDLELFGDSINQFYRAEMERMATWRTRLDQTTNWAVVVMAAVLTWAFSSPSHPHYVLLVGMLATVAFLLIEAQRYQEYDAWRARVRLLQKRFFADVYEPRGGDDDWRSVLAQDLRNPSIRIPYWEAVSHRLAHIYVALLTVLLAAWTARITVFARKPAVAAATIERIPGVAVIAAVAVGYLLAAALAVLSLTQAPRREFDADVDVIRSEDEA